MMHTTEQTSNKVDSIYPESLIEAVYNKFGDKSNEYEAAIKGEYRLGSMIEEYLTKDSISAQEFLLAYEQGDEELWRYYQLFSNDEPYRNIYNQWLEVMHQDVELFEGELYEH